MTVESASFISQLNSAYPAAGDPKSEGDDHMRLIKAVLQGQFTGLGASAVTVTAAELNLLANAGTTGASGLKVATASASSNDVTAASTAMVQSAILASSGITASLPAQGGNSGKYLTTNGTSASWGTVTIPTAGMTLLATLTPTAAANVDFLTTFSSTYDNYLIIGEGIRPSADDSLSMRFAVAGAADSSSNYFTAADGGSAAAATSLTVSSTVTTAGLGCGFTIQIQNANDAVRAKTGNVQATSQNTAVPNMTLFSRGLGFRLTNAITGFRLFWNSASNFAAVGKVYVYGYSNV